MDANARWAINAYRYRVEMLCIALVFVLLLLGMYFADDWLVRELSWYEAWRQDGVMKWVLLAALAALSYLAGLWVSRLVMLGLPTAYSQPTGD